MKEEKRIYVVVLETVAVESGQVIQPAGRQIAQACHVVSSLRHEISDQYQVEQEFVPITTIILQGRDSKELFHLSRRLKAKRLTPVFFNDENEAVYGPIMPITAMAVYARPSQVREILDYLPLWGSHEQSSRCV